MLQKVNIISSLAALALFCLPWVNMKCSGITFATQSGLQIIYGGDSVDKEVLAEAIKEMPQAERTEKTGESVLILFSLIAVIGAIAASSLRFFKEDRIPKNLTAIFCTVALLMILTQMAVEFPAEKALRKMLTNKDKSNVKEGAEMKMIFKIDYATGLWLEMMMLSVPILIVANTLMDTLKKKAMF